MYKVAYNEGMMVSGWGKKSIVGGKRKGKAELKD